MNTTEAFVAVAARGRHHTGGARLQPHTNQVQQRDGDMMNGRRLLKYDPHHIKSLQEGQSGGVLSGALLWEQLLFLNDELALSIKLNCIEFK